MKEVVIRGKNLTPYFVGMHRFTFLQECYLFFKRLLDISASFFFIVIFSPLMLFAALAIKFTTKGPAVFKQERVGQFGKIINVYKFRTMSTDAPKNVATGELENPNAYITKVGKILRLTSFDEILQLFNVLKGDMSIIGPRPIILQEEILHELRKLKKIYSIKPGITGLAQVNGRDLLTAEEKVEFDFNYMKNISLKMDLYILWRSLIVVFKRADLFEGKIKR